LARAPHFRGPQHVPGLVHGLLPNGRDRETLRDDRGQGVLSM